MFFFKGFILALVTYSSFISTSDSFESDSQHSNNSDVNCCSYLWEVISIFFRRSNNSQILRIGPCFPNDHDDENDSSDNADTIRNFNPNFYRRDSDLQNNDDSSKVVEEDEDIATLEQVYDDGLHFIFVAGKTSYFSQADSGSDNVSDSEDQNQIPSAGWTRLSSIHIDFSVNDELYSEVEIMLTFGFELHHPAYDYAKKFLKVCNRLNITPDIERIISSQSHLVLELKKLGIDIDGEEFRNFKTILDQTQIPGYSIIYKGDLYYGEIRWKQKRLTIIKIACDEISRIISKLDTEKFKELIGQGRSLSNHQLDVFIDNLILAVIHFATVLDIDDSDFILTFETRIHNSIAENLKKIGVEDDSLTKAIKSEVRLLLSSPLNLVFNYSAPWYYGYPTYKSYPTFN